ncbi:MAG: crotonase/enoyl-CoA hydratase family protein [Chitinophagales bacterium]
MTYETYKVSIENHIAVVSFNRPNKANCLNQKGWEELQQVFEDMDANPEVRVVVLTGEGKHFCAGIDTSMLMDNVQHKGIKCEGRRREAFLIGTGKLQRNVTAIEKCRKPVIAAIHKACVGGAIDIITACDMRYATTDSYFSIKEIDWALVADLGTLQRLPKIINPSIAAELAYTGRQFDAAEAKEMGLVGQVFEDKEQMMQHVMDIATTIASKSPLCIRGTKQMLLYTRDHTVEEALNHQVLWNAAMIYSDDLMEAGMANMQKRKPTFKN